MTLLTRQIRTLTAKTLRITLLRHSISTPLRALLLPILIVLFLSFTKNFISKDSQYGFGEPHLIRPLSNIFSATTGGRDRILFVSNFTGGQIESVIREVSASLGESEIKTRTLQHEGKLSTECISSIGGTSKCLGAVVFHSSPSEGGSGSWNYTLRADALLGETYYRGSDANAAQVYTLPLQHAVNFAIARHTIAANSTALSVPIHEYPFASKTEQQRKDDNRISFMNMIKDVLAAPFYLALACVIYQMTGFVATEQEIGMSRLLDTMMPNKARWQPQFARVISYHLAFDLLYFPGWIAAGAVLGAMCFPTTTIIVPIFFNILTGLSTTSFAAFMAAFFQKSQLSGIIAIIASLVLAIVAQLVKSGTGVVVVLSLLFPPMNYVYSLVAMTRWESETRATNLFKNAPHAPFEIPVIVFWLFALVHTILFLAVGMFVERVLYGAVSSSRRTVVSPSPIAVELNGFTKEYRPGLMARALQLFNKRPHEPVLAVDGLALQAYRGEIMVLLGANGSGKSTTLDAIAGQHLISSGYITINYEHPSEGFGYCPQKNILWDELTVSEHVKIFDRIKSNGTTGSPGELSALIESCDLTKKKDELSNSLSGGQKRKLQMAMMFTGGSTVCCVDEVSSGVDPLSRSKLWDILLAERGRRSFILTTHFLDEADVLADRISILSKGKLQALGSSIELKEQLGAGYQVHISRSSENSHRHLLYHKVLHAVRTNEIVYFPGTSANALRLISRLDDDGVEDYEVRGSTLEDVFFKIEDDKLLKEERGASSNFQKYLVDAENRFHDLGKGRRVGTMRQMKTLISKRFIILRRNPAPYLALLAIALLAAGCSTLFLDNASAGQCNPEQTMFSATDQSTTNYNLVAGPREQLSAAAIEKIAQAPPGSVSVVETLEDFNAAISKRFGELFPGGFFLGSEPTIAWRANGPPVMAHITQNLLNSLLFNITILSNYEVLDIPFKADLGHYLLFIIYFGLSMAIYPAFLVLYPTMERLRGIRSMHYSNGVRPLPLWAAYLLFDFTFIIAISFISIIIFGATSDVWYAIGYLLPILLLYGIAAGLYSYVISLFSASQLAAFAITAAIHTVFFLAYFVILMVVYTLNESTHQTSTMNIAFFTMGLLSPIVSLARALYITLNVFGVSCRSKQLASYAGAIDLFGGPLLYLTLQSFALFGIVLYKESTSSLNLRTWSRKARADDIELEDAQIQHTGEARVNDGLRVLSLRKQFKKHVAVDDVTFSIPESECFALVGPNGAGKSTSISMIRGDVQPSGNQSEIYINGLSALRHRSKARANLGVCPQIDPLDHMTVYEHLHFYAQIRGLKNVTQSVEEIIEAAGLSDFTTRIASKLSGGNKRKLSLAIAIVGNPSVLLLDEPSSGMDAVSKRIMWRTLASLTPGRSLLLTTHSMEEADALATRVGIISGRMLALGTISEMKARYGKAYFVQLMHRSKARTSKSEMERIQWWVLEEFPEARFNAWSGYGQLKVEIPVRDASGLMRKISDVFRQLEVAKEALGVEYYSVSSATLGRIFLEVVGRHQGGEQE